MKRTIHKWFWLWNFDKEEDWLNEMAAKGLVLSGVGYCRYEFIENMPDAYQIRLEMLKKSPNHPESRDYMRFLEETGVELVGTLCRWAYFRKKAGGASFDLFSDFGSKIEHLNRMLFLPAVLGIMNLFNTINWALKFFDDGDNAELFVMLLCGAATFLLAYGFIQILRKKLALQKERALRE
jgi:hypothetical protein